MSNEFRMTIAMHEFLSPRESKRFSLNHEVATVDDVARMRLRDSLNGRNEYENFTAGTYVILRDKVKDEIIMSDTWMEWKTNFDFLNQARGDVLVAGLGIGMVLLSIQDKTNVTSVTVVEKSKDIIDMVASQLPLNSKVKIVHSDIFDFVSKETYDTIYFDIWNDISSDNAGDMLRLHKLWKLSLNEHGWMNSWRYDDCVDDTFWYENTNRSAFGGVDD